MAMGTGASGNSLRGPRDRNRLAPRLRGVRKARVRRIELEGLESRTLLATIPAATATAGPQNISSLFGNAGGLTANQSSPVGGGRPAEPAEAGGGLGGQRPGVAGDHEQCHRGGDRGGLQHQWRSDLASLPGRAGQWPGDPGFHLGARSGHVRPDGLLQVRHRSQRGFRRQRQLLHADRVSQRRRRRHVVQRCAGLAEVQLRGECAEPGSPSRAI